MPITSKYTRLAQALFNALRTNSSLVSFRLSQNAVDGGRDYDPSNENEAFPNGPVPNLADSPAVAIVLNRGPEIAPGGSKQWLESASLSVYLWLNTRQPDDFHRFVELVAQAILDAAEFKFEDQTSPMLDFPELMEVPTIGDTEVSDPIELGNNWWRARMPVGLAYRTFTTA